MTYSDTSTYPEDGVENIRWDHATDTYIGTFTYIGTLDKLPLTPHQWGFRLRSDVIPDTVIETQDEMF